MYTNMYIVDKGALRPASHWLYNLVVIPMSGIYRDLKHLLVSGSKTNPIHMQIADLLREKIYSKAWPPSTRIPSENDLVKMFGVSRGTVRKALKALVDEGLLVQRHGKGTFVAEPGITHASGDRPLSFAESLRQQGKDFKTQVLEKRVTMPPIEVAAGLGLEPGDPSLFVRRLRTVEGSPVLCQESWSNLRACPGLADVDFTTTSMFDAVQDCSGRRIARSHMRYTARIAGKEHASLLGCDEAAAVLVLEQNICLEDGTFIEWSTTWFPPGQALTGVVEEPSNAK